MPNTNDSSALNPIIHAIGDWLEVLSGEYLLTKFRYPNGGTVVFLRAAHVTMIVFFGAMGVMNWLDPNRGCTFSWHELRLQLIQHVTWLGAIFATVYALLYARFASQWTYLAGVYNQIKAAQVRKDVDGVALSEWKAGFIEDCDDLHLLRKAMFASIAHEWLTADTAQGPVVIAKFDGYTPGGEKRRKGIQAEVAAVVAQVGRRYE